MIRTVLLLFMLAACNKMPYLSMPAIEETAEEIAEELIEQGLEKATGEDWEIELEARRVSEK